MKTPGTSSEALLGGKSRIARHDLALGIIGQSALVLELEEAPRQLDHPPPYPSIAGTGEPFFPASVSTFVGRPREPSVARHGASITQVARQDLLDQHIRRLDANADHTHQNEDHQIWSSFGGLLQLLEARLLYLPDLHGNELLALNVALQFGKRVGRNGLALRCAQLCQTLRRLLELGIEAANAEPRQGRLDAVDDRGVLANEGLALAVGALGIFLCSGRDGRHLAVLALAAQPAQKGALELL